MRNKTTPLIAALCLISLSLAGQKKINTPFSRFNLGSTEPAGSFRSISMGGTGTALRDNNTIYFTNPSSYSSIDTNSFVFDFGLDYSINVISDGTSEYSSGDANFDHLLMAFPIRQGWGVALGIVPLSNGYFNMSAEGTDTVAGNYTEIHKGDGSISCFFLGSGLNITRHISAGMNMSVLFGSLNRRNEYCFTDNYVYNDVHKESFRLNGIKLEYGIQYTTAVRKDYFFTAGASLSAAKSFSSRLELLAYRYNLFGAVDTIEFSADSSRLFIPATFRAGISFGRNDKFVAGADFVATNWADSRIKGSEGYAANTRSLLLGIEYIPDRYSNYSLLKRISYRAGARFGNNYLVLNNEQVRELGINFGLGIPMKRSLSSSNLFFDFTRKTLPTGATSYNERYYTIGLSINLYDFWFIKRKYD